MILERRAALRAAFADFEPAALAGWGEDEVEAALAAPGVIKNRSKARCAVTNARAFLAVAEEWGSFARYLWHWWTACRWTTGWSGRRTCPPRTTCPAG